MSSKIEVETRSQEERARIQIRKWEQSMEMGESKNLTSEFAKLRDAFGTTTSSDATSISHPPSTSVQALLLIKRRKITMGSVAENTTNDEEYDENTSPLSLLMMELEEASLSMVAR